MTTSTTSERVHADLSGLRFHPVDLRPLPLWKRSIDIVSAAVGLVLLTPLLLLVAVAICLESRGGPLYRHTRVGQGGRTFTCWKFRSMHAGAEDKLQELLHMNEANGHIFKMKDDPRRTRLGAWLRKTSVDELPQLWNVLRGNMSLVGPRPPLISEVELYEDHHLERLRAVPGLTGLWQVTARHHRHDFEDMVRLDVLYWERLSFGSDLMILLRTIPTVLRGRGSV